MPTVSCKFVNDVRPKKRKSYKKCRSVLLTEGGRSPTGVSKTGRFPAPVASELAISSQGRTSESGWNAVSTVSFGSGDLHKNRTSENYRTVLGRSCGCVQLCRYARVFWDESFCELCEACRKEHPKDAHDPSFGCG